MNYHVFRDWKILQFATKFCFEMDRRYKIAAICLLAATFSGCISPNPSSEVMVDTNTKAKQELRGEPQNVVPADSQ
ncbi:MAG: hypothetical protein DME44_08560 [Verrucomicrobia bacterium]|nr:MAG: hypothetical protein DME44_08560 [Verrucomicrobiota bacterium]